MTMIGTVKYEKIFGLKTNKFIIAGDSRITRPSELSGKLEARFDSAQKILELSPNILIGLAGDYKVVTLLANLEKKLNTIDVSGGLSYKQYAGFLKKDIKDYLVKHFNPDWLETWLFIIMQDYKSKKCRLYTLVLPVGTFVELDEGAHFIGGDAQQRSDLQKLYSQNFELCLKNSIDIDNSSNMGLPLIMTVGSIETDDIGGSIVAYSMESNGWRSIGNVFSNDGQNWVSHSLNESGWEQQVNGAVNARLTKDYFKVKNKLDNNVVSK